MHVFCAARVRRCISEVLTSSFHSPLAFQLSLFLSSARFAAKLRGRECAPNLFHYIKNLPAWHKYAGRATGVPFVLLVMSFFCLVSHTCKCCITCVRTGLVGVNIYNLIRDETKNTRNSTKNANMHTTRTCVCACPNKNAISTAQRVRLCIIQTSLIM